MSKMKTSRKVRHGIRRWEVDTQAYLVALKRTDEPDTDPGCERAGAGGENPRAIDGARWRARQVVDGAWDFVDADLRPTGVTPP